MAKSRRRGEGNLEGSKAARVARKSKVAKKTKRSPGSPRATRAVVGHGARRLLAGDRVVQEGAGAKQRLRLDMPGGTVAHCELGFGDAVLMLGSPMPPQFPPKKANLAIYVKNCDATYNEALSAGARSLQEPADQFYGDRNARFEDPFGNEWSVMTHVKDVSEKEMKKAMAQMGNAG